MKKLIVILAMLVGMTYAQEPIFSGPSDIATLTNATATTGRVIKEDIYKDKNVSFL